MKRNYTVEQIVGKLRQVEARLAAGAMLSEVSQNPGKNEATVDR